MLFSPNTDVLMRSAPLDSMSGFLAAVLASVRYSTRTLVRGVASQRCSTGEVRERRMWR